jgi:hypothetical protein
VEPVFGRKPPQTVASQVLIPYKLERKLVGALAVLPPQESKDFDLDGLLIGLAAQHAVTGMTKGDTAPLLVRISFDVFATRTTTDRFLATCGKIDRRLTARLILLLSSLPAGLPRTRLQDCINRLRPFCCGVGYYLDEVAELATIDLSNSFNPIVVLSAAACAASAPSELKQLFGSLQTRRAKILIREIGLKKEVAGFLSLGVDMVSLKRSAA